MESVTAHAELFHHCENEYNKNFDLILDVVRHCILAFLDLAWTSLTKHNLSTLNESNVSNTVQLTYVSCWTIS